MYQFSDIFIRRARFKYFFLYVVYDERGAERETFATTALQQTVSTQQQFLSVL